MRLVSLLVVMVALRFCQAEGQVRVGSACAAEILGGVMEGIQLSTAAPIGLLGPGLESQSDGPVWIASGVMAGRLLTHVMPVLSDDVKTERSSGSLVMHAVIGRDGRISQLNFLSGPEALRQSVMDAVSKWTYRPYLLNGKPVDVETTIRFNID